MKIAFTTLGCKLNFAESSALGKALLERGHTRAGRGEEADVCIINTCSVTDAADHKDRQMIHRIRRQNPNAILIVTGCYAQLKPQEISHIEGVDYVLGQDEKFHLPEFIHSLELKVESCAKSGSHGSRVQISPIREVDDFHGAYSKDDRTRCFLKVQDGCNYFCSYCTIPLARGKSRNPSIATLVQQAQEALNGGAKEIILSGVNIGDFGRSTNEHFIDLLKALDGIQGDYRIRISSCEPNLLSDEIIDFVANSAHFAPHFHIPLQSGSNEVLKIMGRRYTRELFAERVAHIKNVMPHAFIGVDCMVGVRGETEAYWRDYVDFIESLPVSQLHVFTYSERANTRMLEMDLEVVPQKERERRSKQLHAVSARKTEAFYCAHEGYEATVLWESSKKDGLMYGFTENYIKVSCPYDKAKVNTFERIVVPRPC
ncbi:MAG: tRNA (N(6)-L-threonylcarbamoyladenosine(37)-C(2))-methylthiotransferase MtaB [Paludibacteraceae bacterium]|nr:tRNA (N(6)-L-threonylcarbamoyladenosine(37)-C(2))-methylthiotransferase MtaB [Paludibacteraceae bacterium]MBR4704327.1 tRNA (N(6)-L-threonylcarbamoyladenosine(37)-C(2))-methylthiotransferase MtaB [Paludibacteraceae bacterium]